MICRTGSFLRAGRLTAADATGLRARSVHLQAGHQMPWHSTRDRQEMILILHGAVVLQYQGLGRRVYQRSLRAGRYGLLAPHTLHRVLNSTRHMAHYVYVTAPGSP